MGPEAILLRFMVAPETHQTTRWSTLALATFVYLSVLIIANAVDNGAANQALDHLDEITRGWVTPQLILPLATLLAVYFVIRGRDQLRWIDVGWRTSALLPAASLTAIAWLAMHPLLFVLVRFGFKHDDVSWTALDASVVPTFINQALGNAMVEETFFRGYLIIGVLHLLSGGSRRASSVTIAAVLSLALFVLSHVPRLLMESSVDHTDIAETLFRIIGFGCVLTLVFVVTDNVFVCVGLHSIWNTRPLLFAAPDNSIDIAWTASILLSTTGWWLVTRARGKCMPGLKSM
jgi:CAAX protease family protein